MLPGSREGMELITPKIAATGASKECNQPHRGSFPSMKDPEQDPQGSHHRYEPQLALLKAAVGCCSLWAGTSCHQVPTEMEHSLLGFGYPCGGQGKDISRLDRMGCSRNNEEREDQDELKSSN